MTIPDNINVDLPPFVIESITLKSHDTTQPDTVCRTLTVEFDSQDFSEFWPVIRTADGFAIDPMEMELLTNFLWSICHHNKHQAAKWEN